MNLSDLSPASGHQGRSCLAGEDVRPDAPIAQGERCPRSCTIEKRTSVLLAGSAEARYLCRLAVIPHSGDRATHDNHPHDHITNRCTDRKQMADHRLVVSVMLRHEGVGLVQSDFYVLQFHLR